jgi:hypothetical protein
MMESSRPVYDYTCLLGQNKVSGIDTATGGQLAKVIQALESWIIIILVDFEDGVHPGIFPGLGIIFDTAVLFNSFTGERIDPGLEVPHIVWMMERLEFLGAGFFEVINVKIFIEAVGINE